MKIPFQGAIRRIVDPGSDLKVMAPKSHHERAIPISDEIAGILEDACKARVRRWAEQTPGLLKRRNVYATAEYLDLRVK